MSTDPRASVKARLTSSLFNTRGEDGNPIEQYITHVKITEDSAHPSSPPPNGADISNRKQRVIVVSVQRNGIVRMHKTRENSNGTFSIGKTWGVDQLDKLEETDAMGFVITIQKPYYWMTDTSKEKYAFITALIQVYRKFTGGKTPEIIGFESIFRQSGSGAQGSRTEPPPSTVYSAPPPQAPSNPYSNAPPPSNPYAAPAPSNPYAAAPSQSQANPYAATPSNPYANSAPTDPYSAAPVVALKPQRRPSDTQDRRAPIPEGRRSESRGSNRSSPERPRSRDKQSRDLNGTPVPPIPAVPPLNIRQTSSPSILRATPSEASLASEYSSQASQRRQRQEDDTASVNSIGSRTGRSGGPRSMASVPALRASPAPSQRALAESALPGRPGSAGRSTPPSPPQVKAMPPLRHGQKLSISTSTSLPSKLHNGALTPTNETSQRLKSPLRKRPHSIDDAMPSEETVSAAMLEIETLLTSFDWSHPTPCATRLETLLTDELEAVESENVHALVMNDGPQMNVFMSRLDDGIKQCEELDEMLTLYLVELQALADDVNFIESENRGLHVRTANERALEKELSELLTAMSISPREFEVLKQESLEKLDGIDRIEQSLLQVYRALKASSGLAEQQDNDGGLENMQIVREMRRTTRMESEKFLARLREFVKIKFQAELMAIPSAKKSKSKPIFPDHSTSYSYFYRYAGFILFAKEVDPENYLDIQQLYLSPASKSYKDDFRSFAAQWKLSGRKATSDDLELVFSMIKEPQGAVSAVRSATIKRTGTVAKTLRSPLADGISRADKERERNEQEGKLPVGEIFDELMSGVIPALIREQSFVMQFLQLSPTADGKVSYEKFIASADKTSWLLTLDQKRPVELDKNSAKDTLHVMEQLLYWLPEELSNIIEWCRTSDAIQLVNVMGVLEKYIVEWEDTDQTFIVRTLNKQHDKLAGLFHRFVEEQVRAIEDMKVTAKKRQGVLLMFKIFPGFVEKIELQFESSHIDAGLDVRETVNEAYEKISNTMFDSLQAIAKDTTSHHPSGTKDDDDKELLNSHISMIENMHYYRETVDDRANKALTNFKSKAQALFIEHLGLYLKVVIRRPLGRLLDFLQGVETFVQSNPSEDVTSRISFSKAAFKKVLSHYDTKELRKGIDLLHKRVDKHFGPANTDDSDAIYGSRGPSIARALVQEVWRSCQKEYVGIVELCKHITATYYPDGVQMEFTLNDVNEAFAKRG